MRYARAVEHSNMVDEVEVLVAFSFLILALRLIRRKRRIQGLRAGRPRRAWVREIFRLRKLQGDLRRPEVILKASCGMNFEEFVIFLNTIADHRIPVIKGDYEKKQGMESNLECQSTVFEDWCKAMKSLQSQESTALISYCQFDLQKIEQCISRFKEENKSLSINL